MVDTVEGAVEGEVKVALPSSFLRIYCTFLLPLEVNSK